MELVERDTFTVCGWAVGTNAEHNDRDLKTLYDDFFTNGKDAALRGLGAMPGLIGLTWYTTPDHTQYAYLLGGEVNAGSPTPDGALKRTLPATRYAVVSYDAAKDIIQAWTEFFFTDIPQAGWAPNFDYNQYFEYYPDGVGGDYQLWVPVVPVDA